MRCSQYSKHEKSGTVRAQVAATEETAFALRAAFTALRDAWADPAPRCNPATNHARAEGFALLGREWTSQFLVPWSISEIYFYEWGITVSG